MIDSRGGAAVSGVTMAAPSAHVRSASAKSRRAFNRLGGTMGKRLPPLLVDFYASDPDNSAEGLDVGDTLTLVFDTPTDVGVTPPQPWGSGVGGGAISGDAKYVDSLFRFCKLACPADDPSPASAANLWAAHSSRTDLGSSYKYVHAYNHTMGVVAQTLGPQHP